MRLLRYSGTLGGRGAKVVDIPHRSAARLIVFDSTHRLLLFQYFDRAGSFWVTPGGGLHDGEDFAAAARREAREELGATSVALTPLWEHTIHYELQGQHIHQFERFFLLEAPVSSHTIGSQLEEHRREGITAVHWWSPDELQHRTDRIFPQDLLAKIAPLLPQAIPSQGGPR